MSVGVSTELHTGSAARPRELDVRRAAIGGAFAAALVGVFALATSGPVGPLPLLIMAVAVPAAAWRLRRGGAAEGDGSPGTLRTGLATFLVALAVVPAHALLSGSWLLGGIDLLAILQANRLLALRDGRATGHVLLLALLMLMAAAVLTIRIEFFGAVFLFCMAGTWTAIFRTLEDPRAAGEDARVPRSLAAIALAAGLGVFAITLVLFAALPRIQFRAFQGGSLATQGVSGFSEEVRLGDLNGVLQDTRPVMRVTLDGPVDPGALYWRGIALDHYRSGRWSLADATEERVFGRRVYSPETRGGRFTKFDLVADAPRRGQPVVQEILLEPLDVSVLFALPHAGAFLADLPLIARNPTDTYFFRAKQFGRMEYTATSWLVDPDPAALAAAKARVPEEQRARYLQVPEEVRGALERVARDMAGEGSDYARVRRVESALQGWEYDLDPPAGSAADPVVAFVTETRSGWCEQYSSAMVLLLRTLGIPARMTNGFHGGDRNDFGGYTLVRRSDAHSWVEVPFEGIGWVTFDPTPSRGRREAGTFDPLRRAWDYLRLVWTQRVVEYDLVDQFTFLREAGRAAGNFGERVSSWTDRARAGARGLGLAGGLAAAGVAALVVWRRRRPGTRTKAGDASAAAERWWARVERHFRTSGLTRRAGETPRELATRAGHADWADLYYVARFAGRPLTDAERAAIGRILEAVR